MNKSWISLFRDAEAKARKDPQYFLLPNRGTYMSRSHFGDLQFLHAMAAEDGESAIYTKQRIMMWAEFAWGIVEGKYKLDTYLRAIQTCNEFLGRMCSSARFWGTISIAWVSISGQKPVIMPDKAN